MTKKLIIYGIGSQAELAYAYFEKDSEYRVAAFTVEQSYLKAGEFLNLPLLPFENIEDFISPDEASMFIAVGPIKLGSVLEKFCEKAKLKGYTLASYCPSIVKVNFEPIYGENCFFDHGAMFHPFVKIGRGVTLLGSTLAHHTEVGNYSFLSAAVLGGGVVVEDYVFVGLGTVIKEGLRIGKGSIIGMSCVITEDVAPYSVYSSYGTAARGVDSRNIKLFRTR